MQEILDDGARPGQPGVAVNQTRLWSPSIEAANLRKDLRALTSSKTVGDGVINEVEPFVSVRP